MSAAAVTRTPLRPTDTTYVDFYPEMAGVSATTLVTVTLTGPGVLATQPAFPADAVSQGVPNLFYPWELKNGCKLTTSSAVDGSTINVTATWLGGSCTRYFKVDQYPLALTKQIGPNTPAGYGGLLVANYLPGTPANWTIKSQKQGATPVTMFGHWANNHAVTWCDNAGGVASGKYGGALNGAPVVGTGAYTVVLQNVAEGFADRTITFDCIQNVISVAPNPGVDYTGGRYNQAIDVWAGCPFGSKILMGEGNYNPGHAVTLTSGTLVRTVDAATSVTAVSTTNGPWGNNNWTWDGRTFDPGWIWLIPERPHGASLGKATFDFRTISGASAGYNGTRLDWMDHTADDLAWQNPGGGQASFWEWLVVSNPLLAGLTISSTDAPSHMFLLNFYTTDAIFGSGQESQTIRGLAWNCTFDIFNTFWYSLSDNGRCQMRWNVALNRNTQNYASVHPDYMQAQSASTFTRLNAINAVIYPMDFIGNRWIKGTTGTQGGFDLPTGQGFNIGSVFLNNVGSSTRGVWRMFGNAMCIDEAMGISVANAGAGSYIRNNDILQPGYQINFDPADSGNIGGTIYVNENAGISAGTSSVVAIDYNTIANSGIGGGWSHPVGSPPTPTLAHNIVNPTFATHFNTTALASGPGSVWQTRQSIEDGIAPKAGGPMTPAGDGTLARNIGSAGADGKINARAATWDTSLTPGCS